MSALEWAGLGLGYAVTGAGTYVLLVPHRYRVRLKKHDEMRCSRYCECNTWRYLQYHSTTQWKRDGDEKPELRPGLARHEAIESSLYLAGIWPVSLTLLLLNRLGYWVGWSAGKLGKGFWIGLLRPVHRLAVARVDRAQEIAAVEKNRDEEVVISLVPTRLASPTLKRGGVVDAVDVDD